jgi:hypothetical protein
MGTDDLSRRAILMGAASLGGFPKSDPEPVYLFATAQYRIRMTLEFHDNYGKFGLGFRERSSGRPFCLSFQGEEDRNCVGNFIGSIAVARYRILSTNTSEPSMSLREYVRSIDHSDSIATRPPFERVIQLQRGLASDIQVFGYEKSSARDGSQDAGPDKTWCLLRQDLYLKNQVNPFLVVHWKHTLSAIRVLDIIPGDGTSQLENAGGKHD